MFAFCSHLLNIRMVRQVIFLIFMIAHILKSRIIPA